MKQNLYKNDHTNKGAEIVYYLILDDYYTFVGVHIHDVFLKLLLSFKSIINEYQFDVLASFLFSKLFPNGLGHLTKKKKLRSVT